MGDCPGSCWVAKLCLSVFFLVGEKTNKQNPPQNPGTTPREICLLHDRQIAHVICVHLRHSLYDVLRRVLGPFI